MTSIYKIFFIVLAGLLISFTSLAQGEVGDTTLAANADSLNKVALTGYNTRLAEIEKQAKEDSISKAQLQKELASLKTTDNLKKEELQKQLEDLNEKENNRILAKRAQIDSLKLTAKGYPVLGFFNDTLFTIYSNAGSF